MLIDLTIFFLAVALTAFCLFGGTGFGAGILELFVGRRRRKSVSRAFGPAWEWNHLWLGLVVLILLVGFPPIFSTLVSFLYIPVTLLGIAIAVRVVAASIRDRGTGKEEGSTYFSDHLYRFSSLGATFLMGTIVGAAIDGRITTDPFNFYQGYVNPWFNTFSFSVGLFTVCLFGFLAAVYAMGEARGDRSVLIRAAKILTIATVLSGGLVFLSGEISGIYLLAKFIYSPFANISVLLSALLLPVLWASLTRERVGLSRLWAGVELVLVLVAWFDVQHPVVVELIDRNSLTFHNAAAPGVVLLPLVLVLAAGLLVALPWYFFRKVRVWDTGTDAGKHPD